ncbi:hypothetical protein V8E36_005695 [Tilletia maclaganii]
MDIYERFQLPAPPPPGPFSIWSGPERARLPELATVAQASDFVDKLVIYRHSLAIQCQFLFGIAYISCLLFVAMAVIGKKLRRRSWWIFRTILRNQGILIVPNVHNIYALGSGVYAMVCISSYITEYIYYRKNEPVPHLTMWIALQWTPLAFACTWQAWGIYVARAQSETATSRTRSKARRKSTAATLLRRPFLINAVWLMVPMTQFILVLIPGVISDIYLERARHGWAEWRAAYRDDPELSREMLLGILQIWNHVMHCFHYVCICMCIWAVFAFGLFLVYSTVSWKLVAGLRAHLLSLRRRRTMAVYKQSPAVRQGSFAWRQHGFDQVPESPAMPSVLMGSSTMVSLTAEERKRSISSSVTLFAMGNPRSVKIAVDEKNEPAEIKSSLFNKLEQKNDRSQSFFPSVTPSATLPREPLRADSQAHRVLRYFMIQSWSMSCGILCLTAVPIFLAVTLYSAAEFTLVERYEGIGYLSASWVTFVFGAITMLSICHVTFETTFSQLLHHTENIPDEIGDPTDDEEDQTDDDAETIRRSASKRKRPQPLCVRPPPIIVGRRIPQEFVAAPDPIRTDVSDVSHDGSRMRGILAPEDFTPNRKPPSRPPSRPSSRRDCVANNEAVERLATYTPTPDTALPHEASSLPASQHQEQLSRLFDLLVDSPALHPPALSQAASEGYRSESRPETSTPSVVNSVGGVRVEGPSGPSPTFGAGQL